MTSVRVSWRRFLHGDLAAHREYANAVAFLASDEAAYITGETLHVNGGMSWSDHNYKS
ncbi:SDR family oxidoreductase [Escherichia coli]